MRTSLAQTWRLIGWVPLLAACGGAGADADRGPTDAQESGLVRGALTYGPGSLPREGYAAVVLRRAARGEPVAEARRPLDGAQVPLPFEIPLPSSLLPVDEPLVLSGMVVVGARPVSVTEPVSIDVAGALDVGEVEMYPAPEGAFAALLLCGAEMARVDFDPAGLWLGVGGRRFELRRAVSASGARYVAADDSSTSVWNKGATTTVTVEGRTLRECATRRSTDESLRARGNEPFWTLEIQGVEMTFRTPDGTDMTVTGWHREGDPSAVTYTATGPAPEIVATLRAGPCVDTMSGMPYPFEASVSVGSGTYRGCAGEPVDLLLGEEWTVAEIDGHTSESAIAPTIAFGADGRVTGRASCNAYNGEYVLTGEGLTFTPLATTRRACPPPLMTQESQYLTSLSTVTRFRIAQDGALVLASATSARILARR
jgi:heat shock protein HslJ